MNTVLKENEQFKKTLTAEQIVLMQLGKPDFQRQAALKMQGGPTLPLFARLAKKTTVGFEPPTAGLCLRTRDRYETTRLLSSYKHACIVGLILYILSAESIASIITIDKKCDHKGTRTPTAGLHMWDRSNTIKLPASYKHTCLMMLNTIYT